MAPKRIRKRKRGVVQLNFTFNIIDIIGCAVILLAAAFGARRGLFKVLVNVAAYLLALFVSRMAANPLSQFLYDKFLHTKVLDYIGGVIPSGESVMLSLKEFVPETALKIAEFFHLVDETAASNAINSALSVEKIESNYIMPIMTKILLIICTVVVFVVLSAILRVVSGWINNSLFGKKHKHLSTINKVFGFVFGLVKGAVPVCIGCEVINLLAPLVSDAKFAETVSASFLCSFISGIIK